LKDNNKQDRNIRDLNLRKTTNLELKVCAYRFPQ